MKDERKIIDGLEHWIQNEENGVCFIPLNLCKKTVELLKEHDEQKRKWLRNIADNQLANAPTDTMNASKQIYYRGIWYGLQMAYDILTEET